MKYKNKILVVSLLLFLLILSGCSNSNKLSERIIEKYDINDNSIVLYDILRNLYSEKQVEPIVYREQEGADYIFNLMKLDLEHFESYAFLYDLDTSEFILVCRPDVYKDEKVLSGIDKLIVDILDKDAEGLNNVVYTSIGEYLVFIKHDKADDIFIEIEKGMTNWDSDKVTPII